MGIITEMKYLTTKDDNGSKIIAFIVYFALLLDNVLLTVIVPIIPEYLAAMDYPLEYTGPNSKVKLDRIQNSSICNSSCDTPMGISTHAKAKASFAPLELTSLTKDKVRPISNSSKSQLDCIINKRCNGSITKNFPAGSDVFSLNIREEHRINFEGENGSIGVLLAMKALVQLIFNPLVGNISTKLGYESPIILGTILLFISSLVFCVGTTYSALLLARAVHGAGAACIGVCGMSLIAQRYPDQERRSKVMGVILGSIALGVLIGYPFGGVMYDLFGKSAPYCVLTIVIFLNICLQLTVLDVSPPTETVVYHKNDVLPLNWSLLVRSKLILAIVIAIWISTSTMAVMEPCLPIWLLQNMKPTKWQLGTVFIPDSLGYFIGTHFFGGISYRSNQVLMSLFAMVMVGVAAILIPSSTTMSQLLLPHFGLGLGIGIIDSALVPLLAKLVDAILTDVRIDTDIGAPGHSTYGTVYAIQQTSVSLAYCLAPLLGGELAQKISFGWLMRIMGISNIFYGLTMMYLYRKHDSNILGEANYHLLVSSQAHHLKYKQSYDPLGGD